MSGPERAGKRNGVREPAFPGVAATARVKATLESRS